MTRLICNRPPEGWWCSRTPEHDGPCAARPIHIIKDDILPNDRVLLSDECMLATKTAAEKLRNGEEIEAYDYGYRRE